MKESVFGVRRRTAAILVAIIVGFALLTSAYTLTLGRTFRKPSGDGVGYEKMAKQLLTRHVYGYKSTRPNAYVSPGYPLLLAGVYGVSGHAVDGRPRLLLVGLQILLACGTLFAVFLIGRRLANDAVGLTAAALVALYPPTIVATNLWLTETLGTFTLMWFVYAALVASQQKGWKPWALAGALLGLAILVRPAVLPLGVAPLLVLSVMGPRVGLVRAMGAFGVALVLVMTPWVVRNEITLHEPAVLSSHSGDPLLAGVDPYYYELGPTYTFHGPTYERYYTEKAVVSKQAYAQTALAESFQTRPLQSFWWFSFGKGVHLFEKGWLASTGYVGTWSTLMRSLIVVLGWIGVVYSFKNRRLLVLASMIVLGTAGLLPFVPEARFVFSYIPLLAVLAACLLQRLWSAPILVDEGSAA